MANEVKNITAMQDLFGNEVKEDNGAAFSECGKYRYELWRIWDTGKPLIMVIGLNPSTANNTDNDPTINCVIKFCKQWGYGGFYMMNLFAFISSKPEDLLTCGDPLGNNDYHLKIIGGKCKDILFAWGKFKQASERRKVVQEMFPYALCIGQKDGHPFHPLWAGVYAPKEIKLTFTQPILFNQ